MQSISLDFAFSVLVFYKTAAGLRVKGGILGSAQNFHCNPYLNGTTGPFDTQNVLCT